MNMDSVVHFEIPADDVKRASAFDKKAFGWDLTKYEGDMEYWMVGTTEVTEEGMPKNPVRSTEAWARGAVPSSHLW